MHSQPQVLEGYSQEEKLAYLSVIASIATADREGSQDELDYLSQLADAAGLDPEHKTAVLQAALEEEPTQLPTHLDILKRSELKYSLVADLMGFAKADQDYSEEEKGDIQKVATYLGLDEKQAEVLNEIAGKTADGSITPEQANDPGFLSAFGFGDKLQKAGINSGGLFKNLLGMAAPFILGSLLSKGFGSKIRQRGSGGGGGLLSGGLGSVIGMLSGGRGMGSLGGILGKFFR